MIIRFAGDSGDGIQITGAMFTHDSAVIGHDISTLPDYPAEIRAPIGTLAGVSSFQLNFSSRKTHTPGDRPDVLVALNPAALKVHLKELVPGGVLIINEDSFQELELSKAGYEQDPREDGSLDAYQVHTAPITEMTIAALEPLGVSFQQAELCKNMYTLGIVCWLFHRTTEEIEKIIDVKFKSKPEEIAQANKLALNAGYSFADTVELFASRYRLGQADLEPGLYRRITGNSAAALGFLAVSQITGRPLFCGAYPITPASDILHDLNQFRNFGVRAGQLEDEIAAMGATIGAAYGGSLAMTTTSGPGIALKSEAIGLAVMVELPMVIVNVQRGGPSTGLPTKTEQADLLQAFFGRNGECPAVIVAASTPSDCFDTAIEAFRIALKYMIPVFYLSDGYLANGSEPWKIPEVDSLPHIEVKFHTEVEGFQPYQRDPDTLARPWAIPGTPGLEHRLGGIEKEEGTGNICYDPENHERMVHIRAEKLERIAADIPDLKVNGPGQGEVLVLGWGSTAGAIRAATEQLQGRGVAIACAQLRHLNPFPSNLGSVLRSYKKVLVPEMNMGQLSMLLRAKYLVDAISISKVQGKPFGAQELEERICAHLDRQSG
jgi:2-oxoglutarate ferredoxin oxidoreductase subunit alpha